MRHLARIAYFCCGLGMAALGAWTPPVVAQASPAERARVIIEGLAERTTLPKVEHQARLEAAPAEVCHELGTALGTMDHDRAKKLVPHLAASRNRYGHAALLYGMTSPDEGVRALSLDALVSLSYDDVLAVGDATRLMRPGLFERLREGGMWSAAVTAKVRSLCSLDAAARATAISSHQQAALALVVDLYGGEGGYVHLIDELVKLMVGEAVDPADLKAVEGEVEGDGSLLKREEPAAGDAEPEEASSPKLDEIRRMLERRRGAVDMFRRLLMVDPDGFFQLGHSTPYERRVERAAAFWDRYGGVEMATPDAEKRDAERTRLIRNDYVREHGEVRSWLGHISWVQREAQTRDEQIMALVVMDELVGGVKIAGEKPKPEAGGTVDPDEPVPMIPVFSGETDSKKIENFMALDGRREQRPRIRAIRKAFEDKFGAR